MDIEEFVQSYHSIRSRISIGLKDLHLRMILNFREDKPDEPIAVNTHWTVCGGDGSDMASSSVHSVYRIHNCESEKSDEDLQKGVKDFSALDSFGIVKPSGTLLSVEDQQAQCLQQSLTRFTVHRYETGLLWSSTNLRLPSSQTMALRRFQCLENRMQEDKALTETMKQMITNY